MSHPDIQKALEWAKLDVPHGASSEEARAAERVILSLPDQWFDAEKLRKTLKGCDKMTSPYEFIEHIEKTLLTPSLPCPEDVPAGEPWSVRYHGEEWVGVRANEDGLPWSLVSMDGLDFRDVSDHFITLISRLVPEVSRG